MGMNRNICTEYLANNQFDEDIIVSRHEHHVQSSTNLNIR